MSFKRIAAALFSLIILGVGGALAYVSLVLLDPERIKPFLLEQVQSATGRTLIVEGEFTPTLSLSPTLAVEKVSLGNADWGKAEKLLVAERLEISFSLLPLLSGQFSVQSLSIQGAQLWLEQKGDRRNWELSKPKAADAEKEASEAKESGGAFAIDEIAIQKSELHFADLGSGSKQSLLIESFNASDVSAEHIEQAALRGSWNGVTLQAGASLTDGVLQLKATADKGSSKAALNGSVSLADQVFDAHLDLNSGRIGELMALSGGDDSNPAPVSLNTSLGGTPALINISKLALTYDAHSFTATGKLDRSNATPLFTGAVTSESLNLKNQAAQNSAPKTADAPPSDGVPATVIPRDALPFDALGLLNADVAIKIAKVEMDKGGFTDVSAKLALQNSKLTLSDISAQKADGSLSGSLSANAQVSPPAVSLQLATHKLTLGALMKELSGADSVEGGNMTAKLQLSGAGQSLHEILASAGGSYDMLIEQATYTPPQGVQEASRFFDVLRGSSGSGPVDITCSIAQFGIEQGVATSKALAVQSPNALVSGDGNVNLSKETLRFELKARSTVLGFADVVPPLVISGGWAKPSVGLSAESALLNIGKFALGAATGVGLVAIVGEQFTDKLGITADNNPCLKSMQEAAEKAKAADSDPKAAYKDAEDTFRGNRDAIKDNIEGAIKGGEQEIKNIEDGIKGLKGLLGK